MGRLLLLFITFPCCFSKQLKKNPLFFFSVDFVVDFQLLGLCEDVLRANFVLMTCHKVFHSDGGEGMQGADCNSLFPDCARTKLVLFFFFFFFFGMTVWTIDMVPGWENSVQ